MYPRQQNSKRSPVFVQHSTRHSVVGDLEQVFGDDGESLRVVLLVLQVGIVVEDGAEDVEEEVQRELVQEVHLKHTRTSIKNVLLNFRYLKIIYPSN